MIKPIETKYGNHRFRSRLEARWAVFFNVLGVKWDYEKEGYELGNDDRWLPDFTIGNYLIEIKDERLEGYEKGQIEKELLVAINRAKKMTINGFPSMVITGLPGNERIHLFSSWFNEDDFGSCMFVEVRYGQFRTCKYCNSLLFFAEYFINNPNNYPTTIFMDGLQHHKILAGSGCKECDNWCPTLDIFEVPENAIKAAHYARFEYGENGEG